MNILEEIAERTRIRVAEDKKRAPLADVRRAAEEAAKARAPRGFENALRGGGVSFIWAATNICAR